MTENQNRKEQPRRKGPLPPPKKGPNKPNRSPFNMLILVLAMLAIFMAVRNWPDYHELRYDQLRTLLKEDQVAKLRIQATDIIGELNDKGYKAAEQEYREFKVNWNPDVFGDDLMNLLAESSVEFEASPPQTWIPLLVNTLLPVLLLVAIIYFLFLRNVRNGAGGMLMNFGRSKHRVRGKEQVKVTFKDVAGIEEAKDEVDELIEFLKNPKKFHRLGGRIPRGVLLVGPPGCGKTLLAKAIAGEADVPFFSISGSDFVEMFVGVGASRVRDLFKQAKDNSPCIIFLDEIDAIGRKRGPGFVSGGHDEREQTLNAILVEMDGFDTNDQVIVIAATNRGDILDHALTRPGRFDRQINVPLPDLKGRLQILRVHSQKIKLSDTIDLERIARGTPMFSGAELEAIINEGAIAATMANKDAVETEDLEEARDKVRWGRAKKSRAMDKEDKRLTAYHEAGHALVQSLTPHADPLHKVSIIPRGPMGGATFALPEKDRMHYTRKYCMSQLQVCFGGRIAEELFCDDISSGAMSDIQQATRISHEMVMSWGMSEKLGPINYSSNGTGKEYFFGSSSPEYSQKTAEQIDQEIKGIINEAYGEARSLIESNRDKLSGIAESLLKYETLDDKEVKAILEGREIERPTVSGLLAREQEKDSEKAEDKQEKGEEGASDKNQEIFEQDQQAESNKQDTE